MKSLLTPTTPFHSLKFLLHSINVLIICCICSQQTFSTSGYLKLWRWIRGTFGYVDPEYRKNHHVNASGDVYSFGVVLLQLLSGQRVINLDSKRTMSLNKMVRDNILSINSILSVSESFISKHLFISKHSYAFLWFSG